MNHAPTQCGDAEATNLKTALIDTASTFALVLAITLTMLGELRDVDLLRIAGAAVLGLAFTGKGITARVYGLNHDVHVLGTTFAVLGVFMCLLLLIFMFS